MDGSGHASTRPVAMTDHSWGAHVAHDARHDEARHPDRLTTLKHGTSSKQGHDVE
jgi:hypothetical protein